MLGRNHAPSSGVFVTGRSASFGEQKAEHHLVKIVEKQREEKRAMWEKEKRKKK
jgi:hypothetical protein